MAPTDQQPRPAMWHDSATEITADQAKDPKYLTITVVCQRTGLRQITLTNAIARQGPFTGVKPIHALVRPPYRVRAGEPRWTEDEIEKYWKIETDRKRTNVEKYGHLPVITEAEAKERGLVNLRTIRRITGYALTTLHRWTEKADFPDLVAVIKALGPQPRLVREWSAVRAYLMESHPENDYPETVPEEAWKPARDDVATDDEDEDGEE